LTRAIIAAIVLGVASHANAQAVTGYQINLYAPNATPTSPSIASIVLPVATYTCGQIKTVPTPPTIIEIGRTNPITYEWDDPADSTKACRTIDIASFIRDVSDRLAPGIYGTSVQMISVSTQTFASQSLKKPATSVCTTPLAGRTSVLTMTVNTSYPMTVRPGQLTEIRFTFSFTYPVVYTAVLVNGIETMRAMGDDLHGIAGFWFVAPSVIGNHQINVYARDAAGCEYRSGLVRTLQVKP
jgi:hypothetical protein